ncbi:MAG: transglutaminase domain-containing protein [Phycisphaerales bacterium]|nr:transglutaminase domain-containing protein [Phycisphaerales bacterium]
MSDSVGTTADPSKEEKLIALRTQFIEQKLGANSSHPAMASRRLAKWRWITVGVVVAVIAYVLKSMWDIVSQFFMGALGGTFPTIPEFIVRVSQGLRELIDTLGTIRAVVVFVFTAVFAALLTVALTIRWSMLGAQGAARSSAGKISRDFVFGLLIVFALAVVSVWIVSSRTLPSRWVGACAFAACLPVWGILFYVEFTSSAARSASTFGTIRRFVRQIIVAAGITAVVISGFQGIINSVVEFAAYCIPMWLGWIRIVLLGILNLSPLRIAIATVVIIILIFRVSADGTEEKKLKKVGFFRRLFRKLGCWLGWLNPSRWFRETEEVESQDAGGAAESRRPQFCRALEVDGKERFGRFECKWSAPIDRAALAVNGTYAPVIEGDQFSWLFGNQRPTVDQVRVLSAGQELWSAHLKSLQVDSFGCARESHADLLIQAAQECFEDSADLTVRNTLLACSALATLSRGQRVLYLVPDEQTRMDVVRCARTAFEAMRLETLYQVDGLDAQSAARWCAPAVDPHLPTDRKPPDVLVATLEDYEKSMFGGALSRDVVRTLLFTSEVVIVENLAAMLAKSERRMHFPFLLDKHRVLLQSENRAMQLIVATPPIGAKPVAVDRSPTFEISHDIGEDAVAQVALESLAARLFGGDARLRGHHVSIRPRAMSRAGRLTVEVVPEKIDEALAFVATHKGIGGNAKGACVIDDREAPRRSADSVGQFEIDGEKVPVYREDELVSRQDLVEAIKGCGAIVLPFRAGGRLLRRIEDAATLEQCIVVIASESVDSAVSISRWAPVLPVLPVAEAPALFLAHLRSAAQHFQPNALIRRDDLARFGLGWNRSRWATAGECVGLHEGWYLECDGALSNSTSATESIERIFPAVIIRSDRLCAPRPVEISGTIERSLSLQGRTRLFLAVETDVSDRRRNVRWITSRGQDLGVCDLALTSTLVFEGTRQRYRPRSVSLDADQSAMIEATPYHGANDEPIRPMIDVALHVPQHASLARRYLRKSSVLRLFIASDGHKLEDRCKSEQTILGLKDRAGHANAFGPLTYGLRCGASILFIGSSQWIRDEVEPATEELKTKDGAHSVPEFIRGHWRVHRGDATCDARRTFSPYMTGAFQYALLGCAPGIFEFARVLAFRDAKNRDGVILVCVEPHTIVGTAADALQTLLDDVVFRRRLIGKVIEAANRGGALPVDLDAPEYDHGLDVEMLHDDSSWASEWANKRGRDPEIVPATISTIVQLPQSSDAVLDSGVRESTYLPQFKEAIAADADYEWTWRTASDPSKQVQFGIRIGITDQQAIAATTRFGFDPSATGESALKRCGFILTEDGRIETNYAWMIDTSMDELGGLGERLNALCEQAGAESPRDKLSLIASFVQSFEYRLQLEGRVSDGRIRGGVQMPLETLFVQAGDCDSVAILFTALARASKIAGWSCVVLVDEADGGHAMAAVQPGEHDSADWVVMNTTDWASPQSTTTTPQAIVELTAAGWVIGDVGAEYKGRYVRIAALRKTECL